MNDIALKTELEGIKSMLLVYLQRIDVLLSTEMDSIQLGELAIDVICDYAKIPRPQFILATRKATVVVWRKIACYILSDYYDWSLEKIAKVLHYNQHATVLFHRNKMRWWMNNPGQSPRDLIIATRNIMNNLGLK